MRESVRIFFACALGALIGGLLGLELNNISTWLWLPAALVGGVVGWITYDIRTLGTAIARAWREVIGWRPNHLYWRLLGRTLLSSVVLLGYGVLMPLSWYAIFVLADAAWYTWPILHSYFYEGYWFFGLFMGAGAAIFAAVVALLMVVMFMLEQNLRTEEGWHSDIGGVLRFSRKVAAAINPVVWPLALVYWTYLLLHWSIPRLPATCRLTGRFAKRAFILAHSDLRLLCFVDATIGAVAGYFLGSALLGALVGGVSGLLNYWVVSVKILHLAPAHARNE